MDNFIFYNPVKIIFGKNTIPELTNEVSKYNRILLAYGGGSIKKNGVYDQVVTALANHTIFEFQGIEPNPKYETLMRAVELCRTEKIEFILAVGGGSVIDGCKFIAAAVDYEGDPWEFVGDFTGKSIKSSIPLGTILTLPAAGSEMNCGAVISRANSPDKLPFASQKVFPRFSILDPETTFTLPTAQTANGIVDAFVHITEQYLTFNANASVQDHWAEGLLLSLLEEGPKVLADPENYDARANIMWASTMALNGLLSVGVSTDWATHMLGHELTAKFGLDHGVTLAIVWPSMMRIKKNNKFNKLLRYAKEVWGIGEGEDAEKIEKAITKTQEFFESIGIKTHLSDYGIGREDIDGLIGQLDKHGMDRLGERQDINLEESRLILEACL
ncbi:MAG: iron-containing alcohol dehydrogenase [Gammaproteobacteria bacterium]|nr:iron-containing alcohol dehydrogenase [Gammaproteobacteria bacterium]